MDNLTKILQEYISSFNCEDTKDILSVLKLKKYQDSPFNSFIELNDSQKKLIHDLKTKTLCNLIWTFKNSEEKLLKENKIPLEHLLYKEIISSVNQKDVFEKHNFYKFIYFLSLEFPDTAQHWKNHTFLDQKYIENAIFQEILNKKILALNFFTNVFTKSEIENFTFYRYEIYSFKPIPLDLNLREYIATSYIHSFGNSKRKILYLYKDITNRFDLPLRLDYVNKVVPLSGLHFYHLKELNDPQFSNSQATIVINNEKITTTLENISKYNAMIKNLTNSMNKAEAYGLDGKTYRDFASTVSHFKEDPFLAKYIKDFMRKKSEKAVKKENKTAWLYHSMDISIDNSSETKVKRNKI